MAIIACNLQNYSAHEHLLKLKSMLNVSSKTKLKTNSTAVKGYQESLFPNGKAQDLVNNAAEQQKHRQFLSLEDKA